MYGSVPCVFYIPLQLVGYSGHIPSACITQLNMTSKHRRLKAKYQVTKSHGIRTGRAKDLDLE